MSRYEPLTRYLEGRRSNEAPLSFREVEAILHRNLPASARRHQPWWSNTTTHSHADAWMRAGWKTSRVDLAGERLVFVRSDKAGARAQPAEARGPDRPAVAEFVIRLDRLPNAARTLLERHASEHGCSLARATADILSQADVDRRRRLLDLFPLTGRPSSVDSVYLIREDRDAR